MVMKGRMRFWWNAAVLAALAGASAPAAAQTVNYSRDPGTVVASYRVDVGELAGDDSGPSVDVYGDGRVRVHVPRYRKDAGDFTTRLSEAEMNNLMTTLVANGLLTFDAAAVKQSVREARQGRGAGAAEVLSESTDPSITTIELRVRSNTAGTGGAPAAGGGQDVSKTVRWVGLEGDAQQYEDVAAIRNLGAAADRFKALMQRGDLQPVP